MHNHVRKNVLLFQTREFNFVYIKFLVLTFGPSKGVKKISNAYWGPLDIFWEKYFEANGAHTQNFAFLTLCKCHVPAAPLPAKHVQKPLNPKHDPTTGIESYPTMPIMTWILFCLDSNIGSDYASNETCHCTWILTLWLITWG